jgi:hypothetical protein
MGARVTVFTAQALAEAARLSTPKRVQVAQEIAAEAQADAPVLTGAYRNGIEVQVDGDRVSVVDMDPESIYKEYGTSDTPAHASLTEAAMRHGRYTGWQPRG